MRRMMMQSVTALAALALAAAPGALASQEQAGPPPSGGAPLPRAVHRPGGGGGGWMGGMMEADPLAHLPLMLLHQREALDLTDDQVKSLAAIHAEAEKAMEAREGGAAALHERLVASLRGGQLDVAAYERAVRAEADSMVARRMAVAKRAQRALSVLTPGQRSNAIYGLRLMHLHMMQGGMMHGGMMGGHEGMMGGPGGMAHGGKAGAGETPPPEGRSPNGG